MARQMVNERPLSQSSKEQFLIHLYGYLARNGCAELARTLAKEACFTANHYPLLNYFEEWWPLMWEEFNRVVNRGEVKQLVRDAGPLFRPGINCSSETPCRTPHGFQKYNQDLLSARTPSRTIVYSQNKASLLDTPGSGAGMGTPTRQAYPQTSMGMPQPVSINSAAVESKHLEEEHKNRSQAQGRLGEHMQLQQLQQVQTCLKLETQLEHDYGSNHSTPLYHSYQANHISNRSIGELRKVDPTPRQQKAVLSRAQKQPKQIRSKPPLRRLSSNLKIWKQNSYPLLDMLQDTPKSEQDRRISQNLVKLRIQLPILIPGQESLIVRRKSAASSTQLKRAPQKPFSSVVIPSPLENAMQADQSEASAQRQLVGSNIEPVFPQFSMDHAQFQTLSQMQPLINSASSAGNVSSFGSTGFNDLLADFPPNALQSNDFPNFLFQDALGPNPMDTPSNVFAISGSAVQGVSTEMGFDPMNSAGEPFRGDSAYQAAGNINVYGSSTDGRQNNQSGTVDADGLNHVFSESLLALLFT